MITKEYVFVRAPGQLPKKRYGVALKKIEIPYTILVNKLIPSFAQLKNLFLEYLLENKNKSINQLRLNQSC